MTGKHLLGLMYLATAFFSVPSAEFTHKWEQNFVKYVENRNNAFFCTAVGGDGTSYIVGSSAKTDRTDQDILVQRMDRDGEVLWTRRFGQEQNDFGFAVEVTEDGGCIVAGVTHSYGYPDGELCFLKVDADGNLHWSQIYPSPNANQPRSIIMDSEGWIVSVGAARTTSGDMAGYAMAVDPDGVLLWYSELGGKKDDELFDVIQCSDGNFATAGFTMSCGAGGRDATISKLDRNGRLLWNRKFGRASHDEFLGICEADDGGFFAAGSFTVPATGDLQALVVRVDSEGDLLGHRLFGDECPDKAVGIFRYSAGTDMVIPVSTLSKGSNNKHSGLIRLDDSLRTRATVVVPGTYLEERYSADMGTSGAVRLACRLENEDNRMTALIGGEFIEWDWLVDQEYQYPLVHHFTCVSSLEEIGLTGNDGGWFSVDDVEEALVAAPLGGWENVATIHAEDFTVRRDSTITVSWKVKYPTEQGSAWRENNKTWISLCGFNGNELYTVGYKPNRLQDLNTSPDLWLTREDDSPEARLIAEARTDRIAPSGEAADYMHFEMSLFANGDITVSCDLRDGKGLVTHITAYDNSYDQFESMRFRYKTGEISSERYRLVIDEVVIKTPMDKAATVD